MISGWVFFFRFMRFVGFNVYQVRNLVAPFGAQLLKKCGGSRLTFCFDKKSEIINRVEFTEASGDVTVIQFKDMVLNRDIDDKLFKIN